MKYNIYERLAEEGQALCEVYKKIKQAEMKIKANKNRAGGERV